MDQEIVKEVENVAVNGIISNLDIKSFGAGIGVGVLGALVCPKIINGIKGLIVKAKSKAAEKKSAKEATND